MQTFSGATASGNSPVGLHRDLLQCGDHGISGHVCKQADGQAVLRIHNAERGASGADPLRRVGLIRP